MDKHQQWIKSREKATSNKYQNFSVILYLFEIIIILNLFLSVLIIADYFFTPIVKNGECILHFTNRIEVSFSNKRSENVEIYQSLYSRLNGSEQVEYCTSPIFNNDLYLNIILKDGEKIKVGNYSFLITTFFISINGIAFLLFILFPNTGDKTVNGIVNDPGVTLHSILYYGLFEKAEYMFLLAAVPILLGIIYWYRLYIYIFV